jgi:vacuolar-type H+-ATPase subunit F/Vma7
MNLSKIAIITAAAFITLLMLAGVRSGFSGHTFAAHARPAITQSA